MGGSHHRERIPKEIINEIPPTQMQQENQGQDGRTLFRRMHYRSWEYKDRGDKLGIEKSGGTSLRKARARGAAVPWMDGLNQHVEQV
jgi:hypothetical protein